jgi:WS/DGAT/MGAT family acyltransferase
MDRSRPLWEVCVVDGLEDGGFAVLIRVHHAVLDGAGGALALARVLSPDPSASDDAWPGQGPDAVDAAHWRAARAPGFAWWLARAAREGPRARARVASRLRRAVAAGGWPWARALLAGAVSAVGTVARPSPVTSFNPDHVGPARAFAGGALDLDDVRRVARARGVTVNDVALAAVAGGIARWLASRGERVGRDPMRVMVPVNLRDEDDADGGNRVAMMLVALPVGEPDPLRRLDAVARATRIAKASHQRDAVEWAEALAEWSGIAPLVAAVRVAFRLRPYNLIVTNVPGPPVALYLLGAALREAYPLVPLYGDQAIAVALFSYCAHLYFAVNADAARVPEPAALVRAIAEAHLELSRRVPADDA